MTNSFSPLVWSAQLETGVPEIDEQHQVLVQSLNEAGASLGRQPRPEHLEKITQDLLAYALVHFDMEETMMAETGYAEVSDAAAAEHQDQHRAFSARAVALRDEVRSGAPDAARHLLDFIHHWLIHHILQTDQLLAAHVLAQREAAAARS